MTASRTIGPGLFDTRTSSSLAVVALVAVNTIPIVGVVAFGWSVGALLLLYWFENAIIGVFNAIKMVYAVGDEPQSGGPAIQTGLERISNILFFSVHYSVFWFGHGVFIAVWFIDSATLLAIGGWYLLALAGLVGSHSVSFVRNLAASSEPRRSTSCSSSRTGGSLRSTSRSSVVLGSSTSWAHQ